jgi:hypothetical protein
MATRYKAIERFDRRVTTTLLKNSNTTKHQVNLPESIFSKICNEFEGETGNSVNLMVIRDEITGCHFITICGHDDYESVMRNLNKEI